MLSTGMKKAQAVAERYDKELKATDSRFNFCVRVIHEEGSIFFFESAFLMQWTENAAERQGWLLVFTEHQGVHVFDFDDLHSYDQYSKVPLSLQVLSGRGG